MSLHPTLQPYADAWTHSIEAISELVQPLVEAEWNRRTPCPGWSVRDIVSHVLGLDSEMRCIAFAMSSLGRGIVSFKPSPTEATMSLRALALLSTLHVKA